MYREIKTKKKRERQRQREISYFDKKKNEKSDCTSHANTYTTTLDADDPSVINIAPALAHTDAAVLLYLRTAAVALLYKIIREL